MDIKLVRCDWDDWEGLYINGKLILENNSLDVYEVLKAVERKHVWADKPIVSLYFVDNKWLKGKGGLPNDFMNIPQNRLMEA